MTETMQGTIEKIERDAEKILEEARTKSRKILEDAKSEANKILLSDLPMDDAIKEQNKIIETVEEETSRELENSKKKGYQIKARAEAKIDETVRFIVNYLKKGH